MHRVVGLGGERVVCLLQLTDKGPPSHLLPAAAWLPSAARAMNRVQFISTNFDSSDLIKRKFDQFIVDL